MPSARHDERGEQRAGTVPPATRRIGERDFAFVGSLLPERDAAGAILEFGPQARYERADLVRLHADGAGTFCRFRIGAPNGLAGVYALVVDGSVRYIGECADLRQRFNAGYGTISPKNCYVGGQPTNCRINRRVLEVAQESGRVDLYFHPTPERKAVERQLVARYSPCWNAR
jgi:hypothetical protein